MVVVVVVVVVVMKISDRMSVRKIGTVVSSLTAVFEGDEVVLVGDGDGLGSLVHTTSRTHQIVRRRPEEEEGGMHKSINA